MQFAFSPKQSCCVSYINKARLQTSKRFIPGLILGSIHSFPAIPAAFSIVRRLSNGTKRFVQGGLHWKREEWGCAGTGRLSSCSGGSTEVPPAHTKPPLTQHLRSCSLLCSLGWLMSKSMLDPAPWIAEVVLPLCNYTPQCWEGDSHLLQHLLSSLDVQVHSPWPEVGRSCSGKPGCWEHPELGW